MSPATNHGTPAINWPSRSDRRATFPEIIFRIVHRLREDSGCDGFHDQTVEIALGSKNAFKNANRATLVCRVPTGQAVCAVPPIQFKEKPPKKPKEPRVKELMQMAIEWQKLLKSGHVATRADIAKHEEITRARVTQIMSLLNLLPDIQRHILDLPKSASWSPVTERSIRHITMIENHGEQIEAFRELTERP